MSFLKTCSFGEFVALWRWFMRGAVLGLLFSLMVMLSSAQNPRKILNELFSSLWFLGAATLFYFLFVLGFCGARNLYKTIQNRNTIEQNHNLLQLKQYAVLDKFERLASRQLAEPPLAPSQEEHTCANLLNRAFAEMGGAIRIRAGPSVCRY